MLVIAVTLVVGIVLGVALCPALLSLIGRVDEATLQQQERAQQEALARDRSMLWRLSRTHAK